MNRWLYAVAAWLAWAGCALFVMAALGHALAGDRAASLLNAAGAYVAMLVARWRPPARNVDQGGNA